MQNKGLLLIIAILIVGVAVFYLNSRPANNELTGLPEEIGSPPVVVTAPLVEQTNSGQSGIVTLSEFGYQTVVKLSLTGAPADIIQPAHINIGSCSNLGDIKYSLTYPINGKSETVLDVSLDDLFSQLPLAINIHKSSEELGISVGCADIISDLIVEDDTELILE
ncbi:MAG: hypothetical protein ABIJ81_01190 [Patescibacteria group bacterium]